jgi:cobalt-zinc-cadmium resistance protein CzcA
MKRDYSIAVEKFNVWLVSDTLFTVDNNLNLGTNKIVDYGSEALLNHPVLQLSQQQVSLADDEIKLQKFGFLPKFYVEYGSQKIGNRTGYHSYQIGMSLPLFFGASSARVKSARIEKEIAHENYLQKQREINSTYHTMQEEYAKWYTSCRYYQNVALPTAREQRETAIKIYQEGGMDYLAFIQNLKDAVQVETDYWKTFGNCMQAQFNLEYFNQSSK